MAGYERIVRQDYSAGMFPFVPAQLVPVNGAEDIVNGVLDGSGGFFRRGGGSFLRSGLTGKPRALWAGYLGGALTELIFTHTDIYKDGGATHVGTFAGMTSRPRNPAVLNGVLYLPGGSSYDGTTLGTYTATNPTHVAAVANRLLMGKDDKVSFSVLDHQGTGDLAVGSPTVSNVKATSGQFQAGQTVVGAGIPIGATVSAVGAGTLTLSANATTAGTAVPLVATGGTPVFDPTDYHRFPAGSQVTGLMPLRDRVAVFTTQGLWLISNLSLNLTDDSGNVQQRLDQYSPSLMLWNDTPAGIGVWEGSLIVPAVDGIWLLTLGVSSEASAPQQLISGPIRNLYRLYLLNGYLPGQATVFAGHYLLPILDPTGALVIDILVCRLEPDAQGRRGFPWTHFHGNSLPAALCAVPATGSPWGSSLYLHGLFPTGVGQTSYGGLEFFGADPSGTQHLKDPDGSVHQLTWGTRGEPTGSGNMNTVVDVRIVYGMSDGSDGAASITAQVGEAGATLTTLPGTAGSNVAGQGTHSWRTAKKLRYAQAQFIQDATYAPVALATIGYEFRVRSSGRV